eukprot:TRINITY_DN6079_c0_g1_i1.p1 TRINITY_DN6079_c0_g1~~TRINITY_DN6079_c0_g1_i1.p1  ORF type:complete len:309 (-),score=27.45 TRINITY_DN6079_c0_g1_i1:8-934(-)
MLGRSLRLSSTFRFYKELRIRHFSEDLSSLPHYNEIYQRFKDSNIPDPESSAKWISLHAQKDPILRETLVTCRLSRMPLQYILKEWPFRGLNLSMRPPVFIPRPETEKIVEIASELKPKRVLEIGCGSGAISLALLTEIPSIENLFSIDRSQLAVDLTLENAERLLDSSLRDKLRVYVNPLDPEGSFHDKEEFFPSEPFDLVISNPPYILRKDLHNVQPEIALYEDLRALDGGADGLDVVKSIFSWVSKTELFSAEGSRLLLEVDPCHPSIVIPKYLEEFPDLQLSIEAVYKDFLDRERFVLMRKSSV